MGWAGRLVEWTEANHAYLSVVFSWDLQAAYQRAVWYKSLGYEVHAGGPAVDLNPHILADLITPSAQSDVIRHHNPQATFTSRGCIRRCSFCAVPRLEGSLRELDDWPLRPVICDNNLLACSRAHFDRVIDRLKPLRQVDFNQGLDARLLTPHHANRLAELRTYCLRLAWDHTKDGPVFMQAHEMLRAAGVSSWHIRVYVLIGYQDTPADALYRLQSVKNLNSWPNPMRYQPLDAMRRNEYVAPGWTDSELKRFMRYWSRTAWMWNLPFAEYRPGMHRHDRSLQPELGL